MVYFSLVISVVTFSSTVLVFTGGHGSVELYERVVEASGQVARSVSVASLRLLLSPLSGLHHIFQPGPVDGAAEEKESKENKLKYVFKDVGCQRKNYSQDDGERTIPSVRIEQDGNSLGKLNFLLMRFRDLAWVEKREFNERRYGFARVSLTCLLWRQIQLVGYWYCVNDQTVRTLFLHFWYIIKWFCTKWKCLQCFPNNEQKWGCAIWGKNVNCDLIAFVILKSNFMAIKNAPDLLHYFDKNNCDYIAIWQKD